MPDAINRSGGGLSIRPQAIEAVRAINHCGSTKLVDTADRVLVQKAQSVGIGCTLTRWVKALSRRSSSPSCLCESFHSRFSAKTFFPSGAFYEDASHGFAHCGEEVAAIFEGGGTARFEQTQPCLMDQRSRLEGVPGRLSENCPVGARRSRVRRERRRHARPLSARRWRMWTSMAAVAAAAARCFSEWPLIVPPRRSKTTRSPCSRALAKR